MYFLKRAWITFTTTSKNSKILKFFDSFPLSRNQTPYNSGSDSLKSVSLNSYTFGVPQRSYVPATTIHILVHPYSFSNCLLSVVCVLSNVLGAGVITANRHPGFCGTYILVNLSVPYVNLYRVLFLTCLPSHSLTTSHPLLWSWFRHCLFCEVPRVTLCQR